MMLDDSGLSLAGKRAALRSRQDGRCAVCARPGCSCADHDHRTGLLRGLLCRGCNGREGSAGSLIRNVRHADIVAYLASPPAVGLGWMWALPDWWSPADTETVRARGCTVLAYVSALSVMPERSKVTTAAAIAALCAADLPPLQM